MNKIILIIILIGLLGATELFSQSIFDSVPDRSHWDKTKKNTRELNALLLDPLNLQEFKKAKPQHSNSGGGPSVNYLYKPTHNGFYYFYFVFDGHPAHGPRITTYKKGKEVGGYMDTSEVFIQLSCDIKDKDLGKANLLSYSDKEILKKFGDNYIKKGNTLIYRSNNVILIISHSAGISWFKISRLNKAVNSFEEMEKMKDLISYL